MYDQVRTKARDDMVRILTATTGVYPTETEKSLPRKSTEPIQIRSFEC